MYIQVSLKTLTVRRSFDEFAFHLHTNTIGPIITAQKLLQTNIPIGTIVFMSSDSGSHGNFREMEDGFAAYAASKSALNMAILAMHPGEVQTYVWHCAYVERADGISETWLTSTCRGRYKASSAQRNPS
jgi:NAD(P)-dependent dehydrogenase (short-subunit alcohol dehydrogenase family)